MEEKRQFSRVACEENIIVKFGKDCILTNLLDISLNGALFEFDHDISIREGDIIHLALKLKNTDVILQFISEIVHSRKNLVGVKFVHTDIDTVINLRRIIGGITTIPQQAADNLTCINFTYI
jgi:hypothetical protein